MVERLPVELGSVGQKCSNENRANSGKPFPAIAGWQSRAKFFRGLVTCPELAEG